MLSSGTWLCLYLSSAPEALKSYIRIAACTWLGDAKWVGGTRANKGQIDAELGVPCN
jgi:hypothetical protein